MTARCSRLWQAEAVEDERLSLADRASFERHLETCSECAAERRALVRLRQLGERLPEPKSDPLRRRALHNQLLRRANELSIGAARPRLGRARVTLAGFALAAIIVLGVLLVRGRAAEDGIAALAGDEPRYELSARPSSRWHVAQRGAALRLTLTAGSFAIHVDKLNARQSFTLNLPDGELSVRGTRFTVDVDSRTRRVVVSEGRVVLQLLGQGEVSLGAGDSWPPAPSPPQPSSESAASSAQASDTPPAVTARSDPPPGARPGTSSAAASRLRPAASSERSSAGGEFATAMAAFSQGDFATAERLFQAFEARYPENSHVEDTVFLRAVARLRRGDEPGAKELAREYLRRYPLGFRADEAARIAR
jgi:ferric-dicitrate binding protein FerR (iron transport regulator)